MAAIQKGVGVVWGISTTGYTYTGSGTLRTQTQGINHEADSDETRDENGEVINETTYNLREQVTLAVVPSGATMAAAATANILPKPGDEIKIIDPGDPDVGSATPGKSYSVLSASKAKSNVARVTIDITARRWAGITNYTPLVS